jgi:hypothetical protein
MVNLPCPEFRRLRGVEEGVTLVLLVPFLVLLLDPLLSLLAVLLVPLERVALITWKTMRRSG